MLAVRCSPSQPYFGSDLSVPLVLLDVTAQQATVVYSKSSLDTPPVTMGGRTRGGAARKATASSLIKASMAVCAASVTGSVNASTNQLRSSADRLLSPTMSSASA